MSKAQIKSFADVGKEELDKIGNLARRTIAVNQPNASPSMEEIVVSMKFQNESPRLVLRLIEKLGGANAIIAALTENR